MATGCIIGVGDKTSCGGQVLEGDTRINMFGIPAAREGDQVSCGENDKLYTIIGGIPYMTSHGRRVAGSLDSISGCPCRATLYPSKNVRYESAAGAAPGARSAASVAATPSPSPKPPASQAFSRGFLSPGLASAGEEPGFHIVQQSISREALRAKLLPMPTSQAVVDKFYSLNPGSDLVKAGSIIVLSDPNNQRCTREEAVLMSAAEGVNEILNSMSAEEADFMMEHRAEVATFLGYGSTSIGVGTAIYAKHLENLGALITRIESLHQEAFLRDGHLRSDIFFAERKKLFAQLNYQLGSFTRRISGFEDHQKLKSALGVSPRSLVHHWSKAGGPGQIPGYATHLQGVRTATQIIQAGGWIGVAIGASASYNKIQAVCASGESAECERVRFTETGSFMGGTIAGAVTASVISAEATALCVGIGAATMTAGGIACALLLVGGATYGVGLIGEKVGTAAGDVLYRTTN